MKIPLCLLCGDLSITNLHVFLYFQQSISVAIHFTTHHAKKIKKNTHFPFTKAIKSDSIMGNVNKI